MAVHHRDALVRVLGSDGSVDIHASIDLAASCNSEWIWQLTSDRTRIVELVAVAALVLALLSVAPLARAAAAS